MKAGRGSSSHFQVIHREGSVHDGGAVTKQFALQRVRTQVLFKFAGGQQTKRNGIPSAPGPFIGSEIGVL